MKLVLLKNMAGELIPISYEEDLYQSILEAIEVPDGYVVKLFNEEHKEISYREIAEGEMLSILICEPDFWVEIYEVGEAFTSYEDNLLYHYDVMVKTDSRDELVCTFYYRSGKFYPRDSVESLCDNNIEEEEIIRICGPHYSSIEEFITNLVIQMENGGDNILSDPIKKRFFRREFEMEWKDGFRRTYTGSVFIHTFDSEWVDT